MEKNQELENKKNENKILNGIKEVVPYIVIIVIVLFVKNYIIAPIQVNGVSMEGTLHDGDIMILNKLQYKRNGVERFDIVVVTNHNTHIIKRVIGLPGDTIEVSDNTLYINGKKYKESYLDKDTVTEDFTLEELLGENKVPKGHYFVLGDNREDSLDSRLIGFISEDDIEGIASLTIFPFDRIGNKNNNKYSFNLLILNSLS